jgi:dipeptidyl aminopeptidase/acylaminoacyl peptidase
MTMIHRLVLPLLFAAGTAHAAEVPIGDFFKDPEFKNVSLSPSGEYITVSVPQGDRTVLAAFRVSDMKLIGKWDYGEKKHIDSVVWVNDDRFFMFVSRKLGRFDFHVGTPDVYASNVDGTQRMDVPNGGTYEIRAITPEDPSNIIVQRPSGLGDTVLSKLNVYNAQVRTIATVPIFSADFVVSDDGEPMYAHGTQEDTTEVTMRRDGDNRWTTVHRTNEAGSEHRPIRMDADGKRVIVEVSDAGEAPRVVAVEPGKGDAELLSRNPNVTPDAYLPSSDRTRLLAIRYADGIPSYDFVDKTHPESQTYAGLINAFPDLALSFAGISWDGKKVLVYAYSDVDPGSYYLYDRETGKAKFLLASMEWIKPDQMSEMRPIVVTARDGRKLHGFLTVPRFSEGKNLPLILHPHGGPHGPRDEWGFNPEVQFLANRGYAVLQVNFRGSGGYGSEYERAGYRKWGTAMIDDMTDAVDWAVREGIADKERVCTYGASYGGYAALQTVVREPAKYQCTIGYVGVYDLPLMFKDGDIPQSDWGRNYLRKVLPESLGEQQSQSPAFNIDKIRIPVMLVHGKKDERVPMSQYDRLHDGLVKAGRPPEMIVLEDKEGHGFYDFQNQVDLYTKMEAFLDKHIGGADNAQAAR